jgi:hypothetical protein
MRTLNNTIIVSQRRDKLTNIKGIQQHMERILEAKKKKIEDAQVFLLPSQRAKLQKQKEHMNRI